MKMNYTKTLLLALVILMLPVTNFAQVVKTGFQAYNAQMKLAAFKDGKRYEWVNDDIVVYLNYKTGELNISLKGSDFTDKSHPEFFDFEADTATDQTEYQFKGLLPVREIINQKTISKSYPIELQLTKNLSDFNKVVLFNMTITIPNTTSGSNFRIFVLDGKFDNNEFQLPSFHKFDNEVYITITFSGMVIG